MQIEQSVAFRPAKALLPYYGCILGCENPDRGFGSLGF